MNHPVQHLPMAWNWTDRWHAMRDRLLGDKNFLRWARHFPLTRPIARRRARELFDLCAGFVYSQVLTACVRLRVFEMLADGPLPLADMARRLNLSLEATEQLVLAAIALRLLERRGKSIGLGVLGAAMLANPGVAAMVDHHAILYADLKDPVALLRGERGAAELSRYWAYAGDPADTTPRDAQVSSYSALMAASMPMVAEEVLDAYPFEDHKTVLDVGGGEGVFLSAVAARAPRTGLMLFDLPPVADRARARLAANGLAERASITGGDFLTDALPRGADLVTLIRVIHDHDDGPALNILRAVHAALPEHGSLILAEQMSGTEGAEPVGDAYFGFYLMAMGRGRPRTPDQLFKLLRRAGFRQMTLLDTSIPLQTRVILASK